MHAAIAAKGLHLRWRATKTMWYYVHSTPSGWSSDSFVAWTWDPIAMANVLNGSKVRGSTSCCCHPFCFIISFHSNGHPWRRSYFIIFQQTIPVTTKFLQNDLSSVCFPELPSFSKGWEGFDLFSIFTSETDTYKQEVQKTEQISNRFDILWLMAKISSAFLSTWFKKLNIIQSSACDCLLQSMLPSFVLFSPTTEMRCHHSPKDVWSRKHSKMLHHRPKNVHCQDFARPMWPRDHE